MASLPDSDPVAAYRPLVRTGAGGNYGLWAFMAVLLLGGVWLFSVMNEARQRSGCADHFAATAGAAGRGP